MDFATTERWDCRDSVFWPELRMAGLVPVWAARVTSGTALGPDDLPCDQDASFVTSWLAL